MSHSLEGLRKRRLKWIEANRENNFEEGIKRLLTDLYPDNAHFIYELLQNAEDPQARTVRFTLTNEAVEFEHDGDRLFDMRDVESITSIGASTKRNDPTSIGKFGVGFKAVFAYTNTPQVHSGEFNFRIHDLVVPENNGVVKPVMNSRETRFVFPFDHPTKRPEHAVQEIERGLRALGDNTLLFLRHIRAIEYLLPDGSLGSLERIEHEGGHIEIRARHPGGKDTVSHWLRFEKDVKVNDEHGNIKTCCIAIAYSLSEEDNKKRVGEVWKIAPLDHGQVSIYFPAEKETSNLRFHLHAPFASTVARDSVRDCEANRQLRDHIANLIVESFVDIRGLGMLTMGFLAVLPNKTDNFPHFYEPIRDAIVRAFKEEALTPTRSGGYAPASGLFRGPAKIAEVLNDEDLSRLTGYETPLWAANPPQQNQREDRFLDSLDIDEWGWGELATAIGRPYRYSYLPQHVEENAKHKCLIEGLVSQKNDAWIMRFYALLGEARDTHYLDLDVQTLRIVRAESAQGSEYVLPQEAFFPPEQGTNIPSDITFVTPSVYSAGRSESQKKFAISFLERIGVRPFDAKAVVVIKLEYYKNPPTKVLEAHYNDMKRFMAYWKKNSEDSGIFRDHTFLLGFSSDGNLVWRNSEQVCLDDPYDETGLSKFSIIHGKDAVWDGYKSKFTVTQLCVFNDFLKSIGVMHNLRVERIVTYNNPNSRELKRDYHKYNVKRTSTVIDDDYSIKNIDNYLAAQSVLASRLIWDALIHADRKAATARFRPNQQYPVRESDSQLVCHLKSHAWIPDSSGVFKRPEEVTKDDLLTAFPYDDRNGLLTVIGFGARAKKRSEEYRARDSAAKAAGFESAEELEKWRQVKEAGCSPDEILAHQRQRTSQPEEAVRNPERRRKGVLESRENAPTRESIIRERTIQPGAKQETLEAKAYLRVKYKNADGQLICQCCNVEMPFKVKNDHYFEAIQCVRGLDHHYFENRLALCPTCAAMYQHARETNDTEIQRRIVDHVASETAPSVEIPVSLVGRSYALRFVGTHWFDLKTILGK